MHQTTSNSVILLISQRDLANSGRVVFYNILTLILTVCFCIIVFYVNNISALKTFCISLFASIMTRSHQMHLAVDSCTFGCFSVLHAAGYCFRKASICECELHDSSSEEITFL